MPAHAETPGELARFAAIARVAAAKGWSEARSLREALEELGPTFVKFGQMLSQREDVVSAGLAGELRNLQDRAMTELMTDEKKKHGTERRKRRRRLVIRLADGEWDEIVRRAEAEGVSLASYGRTRIVAKTETRGVRRPPADRALLAQTLAHLGRVGGNLHQLVKHLNYGELNAMRDARQAVRACSRSGTVEERMRAALGALRNIYLSRGGTGCAEPIAAWH